MMKTPLKHASVFILLGIFTPLFSFAQNCAITYFIGHGGDVQKAMKFAQSKNPSACVLGQGCYVIEPGTIPGAKSQHGSNGNWMENLSPLFNGGMNPTLSLKNLNQHDPALALEMKIEKAKNKENAILAQVNLSSFINQYTQTEDTIYLDQVKKEFYEKTKNGDFRRALKEFYDPNTNAYSDDTLPLIEIITSYRQQVNSVGFSRLTEWHWIKILKEAKNKITSGCENVTIKMHCPSEGDWTKTIRERLDLAQQTKIYSQVENKQIHFAVKTCGKDQKEKIIFNTPKSCTDQYILNRKSLESLEQGPCF